MENEIKSIAEKFIKHLESLERMVAYSELIVKEYKLKKQNEKSLGEVAKLIIRAKAILKIKEVGENKEISKENEEFIALINKKRTENATFRYIYSNIDINWDEERKRIKYTTKSPFVIKVLDLNAKEEFKMDSDINQLLNSVIISLVTGLELLIADLFKDFIQNIDQSDFLKSKTISYTDLVKIGSIEEARVFLIDAYTEDLLKQSFKYWLDEIEKRINMKVNSISFLRDNIESIFEVFQRRHLLIHNNGIINSLYLTKVDKSLTVGLEKDCKIEIDKKYIEKSIDMFRGFGLILLYKYAEKTHRKEKDDIFHSFNGLLLSSSEKKCLGARFIYKEVFQDQSYSHSSRLYAQINYYLSYKNMGDFEIIKSEVENFDTSTLSVEYKMAKNILLEEFDLALANFESYSGEIDDSKFIYFIDWPLIKLVKELPGFKDIIERRINSIISMEEEKKLEIG